MERSKIHVVYIPANILFSLFSRNVGTNCTVLCLYCSSLLKASICFHWSALQMAEQHVKAHLLPDVSTEGGLHPTFSLFSWSDSHKNTHFIQLMISCRFVFIFSLEAFPPFLTQLLLSLSVSITMCNVLDAFEEGLFRSVLCMFAPFIAFHSSVKAQFSQCIWLCLVGQKHFWCQMWLEGPWN